jgi:CheY-like chemotaxis protein
MKRPAHPKRVVCVDDNDFVLKVLQWHLEARGYRALSYSSANQALNVISRGSVDAVVLDYNMPEINGGELAAAIRRRRPGIPILMFSGEVEIPADSLALVDKFVQKGQPHGFSAVGDFLDSLGSTHQKKNLTREPTRVQARASSARSLGRRAAAA